MLRAYFGRHKSASTWARSILQEAAYALDLKVVTIHVPEQWAPYDSLGDMIRATRPDLLIMTNAQREWVETLPEMRAFHLIRDPRDIIVSGYFSHLNSHPEVVGGLPWPALVEHRRNLRNLDEAGGLLAEVEFSSMFLDPMAEWDYTHPSILEVRMEDAIADPVKSWSTILGHLDLLTPDGSGPEAAPGRGEVEPRRPPRDAQGAGLPAHGAAPAADPPAAGGVPGQRVRAVLVQPPVQGPRARPGGRAQPLPPGRGRGLAQPPDRHSPGRAPRALRQPRGAPRLRVVTVHPA
ncbi:hypothetical protein ACFQY4_38135 [Catellatospora bangladeshensis]|uniref:hypothetical protein n=1 Tax=Catellatospora bangladeshensis TaxID=310355 RepID=UPI00360779FF